MNKEWSEKNKAFQIALKKSTFNEAICELIDLRRMLMDEMLSWQDMLRPGDYCKMPFINAAGYHSKTIAYSIWHIFRIEDIVVNSLIRNRGEVFFEGDYPKKTGADIITTGNELVKEQIAAFSKQLKLSFLYEYAQAVWLDTNEWLNALEYADIKKTFNQADKEKLYRLHVVSDDENARWLVEYWCDKDVAGLLKMPFSRHWIMHVEAADRIIAKLLVK